MRNRIDVICSNKDNYIYSINNGETAIIVDPGSYELLAQYLEGNKIKHVDVLLTHAHADHALGLPALLADYPEAKVIAQEVDFRTLANYGVLVAEQNKVLVTPDSYLTVQGMEFMALNTPGHCANHLTFIHKNLIFCGDLLFSVGCGRVQADGDMLDLYMSIDRIKTYAINKAEEFDNKIFLFCGHEYTLDNIRFAYTLRDARITDNLRDYEAKVRERLSNSIGNTPVNIFDEFHLNPFLRAVNVEEFTRLRVAKDNLPLLEAAAKSANKE